VNLLADANELVQLLKKAALEAIEASKPVHLCFGTVKGIDPLVIHVEQKTDLGEAQILLTRNVSNFSVSATIEWETEEKQAAHNHDVHLSGEGIAVSGTTEEADISHSHRISGRKKITIHNGLAVGEAVLLARMQGGQQYIVLDRLG